MNNTTKYKLPNNQSAHRFTMWLFIVTTTMIFAGFIYGKELFGKPKS